MIAALRLCWSANIKLASLALMIESYPTTGIAFRLALQVSVSQIIADPRSYIKGQTMTKIVETIKEFYDVDISITLVSIVTDNLSYVDTYMKLGYTRVI